MTKQLFIFDKLKTKLLFLFVVCFALFANVANAQLLDAQTAQSGSARPNYNIEVRPAAQTVKQRPVTLSDSDARQDAKNINVGFNPAVKTHPGEAAKREKEIHQNIDNASDLLSPVAPGAPLAAYILKKMATNYTNPCSVERMESIYKSGCYSCIIVKAMISTFLNACSTLYDLARVAGVKILLIGLLIWIPFYILQQMSSLKNLEPSAMVNDLLIMAFKVIVAFLVINSGIQFFIDFVISPILNAGADFGLMMLNTASSTSGLDIAATPIDEANLIEENAVMPKSLLNNIMSYVAAVSGTVSTHLEIGHMITCHSNHAGAWGWNSPVGLIGITNIPLWISGALIWFLGFMMTLSVTYYLVDISFKIGFTIIALPIVVGLWPFNITKDRLGACVGMVLNAAGIFLFLAMTVAIGLVLVSHSLDAVTDTPTLIASAQERGLNIEKMSGAQKIMLAVEDGNSEYVSNNFSLFGGYWLLIAIAYLYAFKLIGSTISDFVNEFFPDSVMGSASPMHQKMVKYTDIAKKKAIKAATFAGKAVKNRAKGMFGGGGGGKKGSNIMEKAGKFNDNIDKLKEGKGGEKDEPKESKFDSAKSMANMDSNKDKKVMNAAAKGTKATGKAAKASAAAMKASGAAMETSGKVVDNAAEGADKAAEMGMKGGKGIIKAGGALSATGIGAIIGVPMIIAGGAMVGAGAATKVGAKGMKAVGKALQKGGKVMKKLGNQMEKVGDKMDKMAQKMEKKGKSQVQKGRGKMKNKSNDNNKNQNNDQNNNGGSNGSGGSGESNDLINSLGDAAAGRKK